MHGVIILGVREAAEKPVTLCSSATDCVGHLPDVVWVVAALRSSSGDIINGNGKSSILWVPGGDAAVQAAHAVS